MDRVLRGVVEHPLGQGTHRPVGALVLLVQLHAEVALQQRGQAERPQTQKLRGDARVEDVPDLPLVVLLQKSQVVVGVVKNDLDPGILEDSSEGGRLPDGYGVDDRGAVAGRELEQVDSIDESMEAGTLGVQRDAPRFDRTGGGVYRGEKGVDGFRRVEIDGRMHAGNLTGAALPLIRRYPALAAVPRVVLSSGPTPVEQAPSVD